MDRFVSEVRQRYGMRPVLPLEFPIEIGDIGRIASDGSWKPISTVRHRFHSVPGRVCRIRDRRKVWTACSGEDVSFTGYARGETSQLILKRSEANARTEIEFGSSEAFVFAASGVTIREATEMGELIEKIRLAYHLRRRRPEEGRWYRDFTFVFSVGDAEHFTALLPKRPHARVAVTGRGPGGPLSAPAKLAVGVNFGPGSDQLERVNKRDAQGRFYRAFELSPLILERWREDPWRKRNGDDPVCEAPLPSFRETFREV
jgi:hypothetical protein